MNGPTRLDPAPQTGESGPISPMPRGVRGPRFLMQLKVKILISPSSLSGNEGPKIQHPHQYEGAEMMASPRPSMSSARVQSPRPKHAAGAGTDQSGDHRPGVRGNEVHHPLPFPGRRDYFDPNRPASPSPAQASHRRFSLTTLARRTSTTTKPTTIPKPSPPKTPPSPLSSVKQNLKKSWTHLNLLPRGSPNQETKSGIPPRQRLSTSSSRFVEDLRNRKISSPFVSGPRLGGLRGVENAGWRSSFDGATVVGMNELGQLERPSTNPNSRNARHSFQSSLRPISNSTYPPPRHSLETNLGPTLQPNPPSSTQRTTSLSPPPHSRTPTPTPSNPNSLGIKRKPAPPITPSLIRQTTMSGGSPNSSQSVLAPAKVAAVLQRRSVSGPGPDGVLRRPVLQEVQALTLRSSMDGEGDGERVRTAEEGGEA
ncbi:BQ5605_C009g05731 [Microbotryum silenes-dioicae]|uniref:BQ5605_C009g05731 protein n=1 Tax=Microbotryum silenes-dioicae TaxID=796604 RepID=A0A2X0MI48_9BASI|nr:BQ5605_C009g05731 [Microbotryum silenes-dioicae]